MARQLVDLSLDDELIRRHPRHDEGVLSDIKCDENKFQVNVDVQDFRPAEISVKIKGRFVAIKGNHEDQLNGHRYTSRHFEHAYLLPENAMPDELQYSISADGILQVEVARDTSAKELMGHEHAL